MYFGDIIANTSINENYISLEIYKNTFTKSDYNKSFAYMCRLFDKSIKNNNYKDAKKVYSINLIKGNFRRINSNLVNTYKFKNDDNKLIDNGNIELFLIRLDKLNNIQYTKNERFIRWLKIINAESFEELEAYCKGDKIMSEANKFVEEWCKESNKNGLEKYIAEKEAEANFKGKKAGILETAKNLLTLNIDLKSIEKATGLSEKELNKLKNQIC